MSKPRPTKDSRIVIVGASVLGLSTALHLTSRGYKSITLFDGRSNSSPSSSTKFAPLHYIAQHHSLSLSALRTWAQWNEDLWANDDTTITGQSQQDRLWINNGFYTIYGAEVPDTALQRISFLERRHGLKLALLASTEPDHVDSAVSRMFCIDPFPESGCGEGLLDTLGGTILVGKTWSFALEQVRKAPGVNVVFGDSAGLVDDIVFEGDGSGKRAQGVRTKDGQVHEADFVIWACNSTQSEDLIIPKPPLTKQQIETTVLFQLSRDKHPDLWDRLSEDNFPSWTLSLSKGDGTLVGFPRDEQGHIRIIHRGPSSISKIHPMQVIKSFLTKYLPDLVDLLPESQIETRTFYDGAVVDYAPSTQNVLLAVDSRSPLQTLMFLPVIGNAVVDILEGGEHAVGGWKLRLTNSKSSGSRAFHL